ncbi:hypothetical protein H4R20_003070 [Coemansia guatemalensis]|uniref:Piwi domain-containing protein n=1 Tax=Coemansia guatemalensis TaxID=2761395 RepID=A0A9W8LRR1_9FUNG|nr:hypothetical protein H4R20_003070 [Coemansia guatemalensis]
MFALDSILRCQMDITPIDGRRISSDGAVPTDAGFDIWWEYRPTLRATQGQLLLNIGARAVPMSPASGTVADLAQTFFQRIDDKKLSRDWSRFATLVRGLRVITKALGIRRLVRLTPLDHGSTQTPMAITTNKETLALDQCQLTRQILTGLSPPQHQKLLLNSVLTVATRRQLTEHGAKLLQKAAEQLNRFGIKIGELMTTTAQVLPAPSLHLGEGKQVQVSHSTGNWSISGAKLHSPVTLNSWAVVVLGGHVDTALVRGYVTQLVKSAHELGMVITNPRPPIIPGNINDIDGVLRRATAAAAAQQQKSEGGIPPQLLLCLLAHGSTAPAVYGEIKRVALTQIGIQTQCVRYHKARGHHPRLLTQVLLKINVKLGGNTSTIAQSALTPTILEKQTTLVISADVCHASFAAHQPMSTAGVVWSVDTQAQRFAGSVVQHPQRMEIIENLDVIARHALRVFYQKTGAKPQRIMYYRDGANESQVPWVRKVELEGLRQACQLIDPKYAPPITVLIARKRHHARFMLQSENCPPGTVVFRNMVTPKEESFFMLTHRAILGVSKPVHYIVLQNDAGPGNAPPPTAAELHALTYQLAYQYPIVTRGVTMPASLYYAHRLASRGRMQLCHPSTSRGLPLHLVPVHENLQNNMYFL